MATKVSATAPQKGSVTFELSAEDIRELENGGTVEIPNGRYTIVLQGPVADDVVTDDDDDDDDDLISL